MLANTYYPSVLLLFQRNAYFGTQRNIPRVYDRMYVRKHQKIDQDACYTELKVRHKFCCKKRESKLNVLACICTKLAISIGLATTIFLWNANVRCSTYRFQDVCPDRVRNYISNALTIHSSVQMMNVYFILTFRSKIFF